MDLPENFKHIVFDWNGTLLDDARAMHQAFVINAERFGYAAVSFEQWKATPTRPFGAYYNLLRRLAGNEPMSIHELRAANEAWIVSYKELTSEVQLAPETQSLLDLCEELEISVSLCSMHIHDEVVYEANRLGVARRFTHINGSDPLHPIQIKREHLAEHVEGLIESGLITIPAEAVMVGDIGDDASSAAYAGMHAVLVASGEDSIDLLSEHDSPVVNDLVELRSLITALR